MSKSRPTSAPGAAESRTAQIELRHLRYFLAVARTLSFRLAATELGLAQPALSQQIVALERIVGARLFDRTSRSVSLSKAGQIFLREAEQTIRQAERAQRVAERAGRGDLGSLTVAYAGSTLYTGLLSSAVFEFHRRHPDVAIEVIELGIDEQLEAIDQGTLDVGILRLPLSECPSTVETMAVLSEPIVMAMREDHPLAEQKSISIHQFEDEPLISSQTDKVGILKQVLSATARLGFTPTIIRARHFGAIISLVSAGLGMAMVPKSAQLLKLPGIVYRPIVGLEPSEVAIAYRAGCNEPAVRAFLETTAIPRAGGRPRSRAARVKLAKDD